MEKKILRNYRVWFDQVNQTMFDVTDATELKRPASQGSKWYIAKQIKVLKPV